MPPIQSPFTEEHEAFRKTVRAWVEKELTPHALEWDRAGHLPARDLQAGRRAGLPRASTTTRGTAAAGCDYWYVTAFAEELVRSRNAGREHGAAGAEPDGHADHQRDRHRRAEARVPRAGARGREDRRARRERAGLRLGRGEHPRPPRAGSATTTSSTAPRCGSPTAPAPTSSPWRCAPAGPGYGGISLVTFPTDVKGFSVSKKLDKVGNLSSDTAMLYFEDCRIPARYLLGEENEGFYHIMTNFQGERLVAAAHRGGGHGADARGRHPLRPRARGVRQAAHQVPGVAPQVRRAPRRDRGGEAAHLPRGRALRRRRRTR